MNSSDRCFVWYFFARGQLMLVSILSILCTICALLVGWNEHNGDPRRTIAKAENQLRDGFKDLGKTTTTSKGYKVTYLGLSWKEIEEIARPLSWENKYILKAKAMLYFQEDPSPYDSGTWRDRFELSQKPWSYYETSDRFSLMAGYGISTFLISLICLTVLFGLLKWCWYFFLDRLREIAAAVRGNK